jgi:hypothetical protein
MPYIKKLFSSINSYLWILLFFSTVLEGQSWINSVYPAFNSIHISPNDTIRVNFSYDMDTTTFTNDNIRIYGSLTGFYQAEFLYDHQNRILSAISTENFKVGEKVSVTLTKRLKNVQGDSLDVPITWSFNSQVLKGYNTYRKYNTIHLKNDIFAATQGDFNKDGRIDLAVTVDSWAYTDSLLILRNAGYSQFITSYSLALYNYPFHYPDYICAEDFDGDFNLDLGVRWLDTLAIFSNDPPGQFQLVNYIENTEGYIVRGDFNNDGLIDLVGYGSDGLRLFQNQGSFNFSMGPIQVSGLSNVTSLSASDIDNDGDLDLILFLFLSNSNPHIYKNDGSGIFTLYSGNQYPAFGWGGIECGDWNKDGYNDIIYDGYRMFLNDSMGTFTLSAPGFSSSSSDNSKGVDLDADADFDLICFTLSAPTDKIYTYLNDGHAQFQFADTVNIFKQYSACLVADYLNNGSVEMVVPTLREKDIYFITGETPSALPDFKVTFNDNNFNRLNYPNPFNSRTIIEFELQKPQEVVINIYDILGRELIRLVSGNYSAGKHRIVWDGKDRSGHPAGSGIYFYLIKTNDHVEYRKMMIVR